MKDSDGNTVTLTVAVSQALGLAGLEADALAPWPYIKVVMGSAEGGARTLKLCLK